MDNDFPLDVYNTQSNRLPAMMPNVVIESLILMPTGQFQTPYIRNYTTTINEGTVYNLLDKLNSNPYDEITPKFVANHANDIITVNPVGTPSNIIPNGWSENRLRFILVVRIKNNRLSTNDQIAYFQGYTDYLGATNTGALDPNMIFSINSYMVFEEIVIPTPTGMAKQYRLHESSNVLLPNSHNSPYSSLKYIRPNDIFQGMQTSHLTSIENTINIFDYRQESNESIKSFKSNNNNNEYLTKLLNRYINGVNAYKQSPKNYEANRRGIDDNDYAMAIQTALDDQEAMPLSTNPFIRQLATAYGTSYRSVTNFSLKILKEICPYLDNITRYIQPTTNMLRSMPNTADSQYWSARDRETVAATIVNNSLSAIMFDLFITKIKLSSTNMTVNGKPATMIIDVKSIVEFDLTPNIKTIIFRLENEILPSITFNNQDSYKLDIEIDIFGHSVINIAFGGQEFIRYVNPSFADSTFLPVITTNPETRNNIVRDLGFLLENVSENMVNNNLSVKPVVNPSMAVNVTPNDPFKSPDSLKDIKIKL